MPEFGLLQAIVLTLLMLVMIGASLRMPNIWSDEQMSDRLFKTMRSWWPWGEPLLRGWIRALPAGLMGGWLLVAATIVAAMVATEKLASSPGFGGLAILVFLVFLSLGTVASIVLFNRPSFAVPPHLRSQTGAVSEWRGARSRRRSSAG
jgi:hypothetical protein